MFFLKSKDGKTDMSSLVFESAGLFLSRGEWIHGTRILSSYEIIFMLSGKVYIKEEEKNYALEKDDLLLLTPGRKHGGVKPSRGVSFYWLHFDTDTKFDDNCFHFKDTARLSGLFKMLLHIVNTPFYPVSSAEYMTKIILNEIEFLSEKSVAENNPAYMAAEYIASNIGTRPTVTDVAEHLGYNADYLCRLFRSAYGITLKNFIAEETVKKAKILLTETGKSIGSVSETLGFENENLFAKFFKYHEGITPSKYISMCYNTHINHI